MRVLLALGGHALEATRLAVGHTPLTGRTVPVDATAATVEPVRRAFTAHRRSREPIGRALLGGRRKDGDGRRSGGGVLGLGSGSGGALEYRPGVRPGDGGDDTGGGGGGEAGIDDGGSTGEGPMPGRFEEVVTGLDEVLLEKRDG
jgi:hypothetical protein